jgi:transposase InsO family protein
LPRPAFGSRSCTEGYSARSSPESLFSALECGLLGLHRFRTQPEAELAVFDFIFIGGFYNPRRRHSSLGMISPANFEQLYSTICQAEVA